MERQVLEPASKGLPIRYGRLIWQTNLLSKPISVPEVDYLIVEGISSYHPNIAHYYNYKIWVETPMRIATEQGHARDSSNENAEYWDLLSANDLAYQNMYNPVREADIIIENIMEDNYAAK